MKKYGVVLLTGIIMLSSVANVYGSTFTSKSPGMKIFDIFRENGMTKSDMEKRMGQAKGSERMFHSVYDYSINGKKGELKVRYKDVDDSVRMSGITDNVSEDSQVARILWKESKKTFSPKYDYQIKSLGELNYDLSLNDTLNVFKETPEVIDEIIAEDNESTTVSYKDYPMMGEKGTLTLTFEDGQMSNDSNWCFELPDGKSFSEYSEMIDRGWLMTMSDIMTALRRQYSNLQELMLFEKLCDYYLDAYGKNDTQKIKNFDAALRDFYRYLNGSDDSRFLQEMELLSEAFGNEEEINIEEFSDRFLNIWISISQCEYSWDQIIEADYDEDHFNTDGQPVSLGENIADENLDKNNSKYIELEYSFEGFDIEE